MAFKPMEQKIRPIKTPETQVPAEEHDLGLEKEITKEEASTKEKLATEQNLQATEQTDTQLLRRFRKPRPVLPIPAKDVVMIKIEKIMEDGLNDSYQRLSPVAKQEFKLKGEQTASQIRVLLKSTHVKVKKILRLILDWLRMLPGTNHFFLEQEAKIKTDKIISLKNK